MTSAAVSVDTYLRSKYEPDMEYVEGHLVARSGVGNPSHGLLQTIIGAHLLQLGRDAGFKSFTATRLFVSSADGGRYRIPDVMAVASPVTSAKFVIDVPLITVEILSPDHKFDEVIDK